MYYLCSCLSMTLQRLRLSPVDLDVLAGLIPWVSENITLLANLP